MSTFDSLYMIYDYISSFDRFIYNIWLHVNFDRFRLILETIFLPLYYKAFYKHKGETLLTCFSTHWENRGGISPLAYVKLHIISVKLQLTGKSSLTYQLYFSIHFQFWEWYEMFKVENIHTQVHIILDYLYHNIVYISYNTHINEAVAT